MTAHNKFDYFILHEMTLSASHDRRTNMSSPDRYWIYRPSAVATSLASRCSDSLANLMRKVSLHPVPTENSQPLFAFFSRPAGLPYRYFGRTTEGLEWPDVLVELESVATELAGGQDKPQFNAAFVNLYRDGRDCVTPHRDKTHGSTPIVSFSFYEDRENVAAPDLRALSIAELAAGSSGSGTYVSSIPMAHASALVMLPGMQEKYVHWVEPTESKKSRINVTFRIHPH